jgi:hypothetical protein
MLEYNLPIPSYSKEKNSHNISVTINSKSYYQRTRSTSYHKRKKKKKPSNDTFASTLYPPIISEKLWAKPVVCRRNSVTEELMVLNRASSKLQRVVHRRRWHHD